MLSSWFIFFKILDKVLFPHLYIKTLFILSNDFKSLKFTFI